VKIGTNSLDDLEIFSYDDLYFFTQVVGKMEVLAGQRGRNSSTSGSNSWPENGLRFAEAMLAAMQFGGGGTGFNQFLTLLTLNQQRTEADSPLSHLTRLIVDLGHLATLYRRFRIRLSLAEFQAVFRFQNSD
jgi:hypothetical protein